MHARFIGRTSVRIAASLAVLATAAAFGVTPASAAQAKVPLTFPGDNCGISQSSYFAGETCAGGLLLFYHANGGGSTASLIGNVANLSDEPVYGYNGSTIVLEYYADYVFWDAADSDNAGGGQGVRNNVASVSNTSSSNSYTLYVYPNFTGPSQRFGPNDIYANLDSQLVNNEASMAES